MPNELESNIKKKRSSRVKKACIHCRKRKQGCDEQRPCSRCVHKKICCVEAEPRKKEDQGCSILWKKSGDQRKKRNETKERKKRNQTKERKKKARMIEQDTVPFPFFPLLMVPSLNPSFAIEQDEPYSSPRDDSSPVELSFTDDSDELFSDDQDLMLLGIPTGETFFETMF